MSRTGHGSLLFFGSGAFSRICLESFLSKTDGLRVTVVVPPRPCELERFAGAHGLKVIRAPPRSLRGWLPVEEGDGCDFGVVASFGYFLPAPLLDWFRIGVLNVHPSLLPAYRGAAPIQRSLMDGCEGSGVSIIDLDRTTFDAGRIYHQEGIPLPSGAPYPVVEQLLAGLGGAAAARVIQGWDTFDALKRPQSGQITYAPKITVEDASVRFATDSSAEIYRRHLAIGHQESLRTRLKADQRAVHLLDVGPAGMPSTLRPDSFEGLASEASPGAVYFERPSKTLWAMAADQRWLPIKKFRVEGKSSTFDAGGLFSGFRLTNFRQPHLL